MSVTKTYQIVKEDDGWVTVSTPALDRDKDRVMPLGLELESYRRNPLLMWGHNYRDPFAVIGRAADMQLSPDAFKLRPEFREPASDDDPMHIIRALWDADLTRAFSIGFVPKEWVENEEGGRDYTRAEILEVSLVPIPANQEALKQIVKAFTEDVTGKTVIPYSAHGDSAKADEGQAWDGAGARARLRQWAGGDDWSPAKYRRGFVFVDGEPDLLGSYKGPHHDIIGGGFKVVWAGVRAAMGSLVFGARGGRVSEESARRGIYGHLAKHYRQYDKDVPEFRDYDEAELKAMFPELYKDEQPEAAEPEPQQPVEQPMPEELDAPAEDVPEELIDALADFLTEIAEQIRSDDNE